MDDAALVCVFQRHADLNCRLDKRCKILGRLLMQARALDEFHHNEWSLVHLARVVDRDDIGVIELCDRLGLSKEARSPLRFHLEASHDFYRHIALKSRVKGAVNRAHATLAEFTFETVAIIK